jgi:hypothetical protein
MSEHGQPARPQDCAAFAACVAEVALGVASPEEADAALAHARSCPSCARELAQLQAVGELLLERAPSATPPRPLRTPALAHTASPEPKAALAGPAGPPPLSAQRRRRVFAAAGARRSGLSRSGRRATAFVVAAALAVAVVAAVLTSISPRGPERQLTASLIARGRVVGQVRILGDSPTVVQISLVGLPFAGQVHCAVRPASGHWQAIGAFPVVDGRASWSGTTAVALQEVRGVLLSSADGRRVAGARL